MKKIIDRYNERLANDEKFNKAVLYGSILLQSICTIGIFTASYFGGMRKGVDITDAHYEE